MPQYPLFRDRDRDRDVGSTSDEGAYLIQNARLDIVTPYRPGAMIMMMASPTAPAEYDGEPGGPLVAYASDPRLSSCTTQSSGGGFGPGAGAGDATVAGLENIYRPPPPWAASTTAAATNTTTTALTGCPGAETGGPPQPPPPHAAYQQTSGHMTVPPAVVMTPSLPATGQFQHPAYGMTPVATVTTRQSPSAAAQEQQQQQQQQQSSSSPASRSAHHLSSSRSGSELPSSSSNNNSNSNNYTLHNSPPSCGGGGPSSGPGVSPAQASPRSWPSSDQLQQIIWHGLPDHLQGQLHHHHHHHQIHHAQQQHSHQQQYPQHQQFASVAPDTIHLSQAIATMPSTPQTTGPSSAGYGSDFNSPEASSAYSQHASPALFTPPRSYLDAFGAGGSASSTAVSMAAAPPEDLLSPRNCGQHHQLHLEAHHNIDGGNTPGSAPTTLGDGTGPGGVILSPSHGGGPTTAGVPAAGGEPYAQLICRAFLSHPREAMTLQEIYQWFRDNTDKAKTKGKGWQNSIRHNLSMNGAFLKEDRSAQGAGGGSSSSPAQPDPRKSTEWHLAPWARAAGRVHSTTRYRKGAPHRARSSRRNAAAAAAATTAAAAGAGISNSSPTGSRSRPGGKRAQANRIKAAQVAAQVAAQQQQQRELQQELQQQQQQQQQQQHLMMMQDPNMGAYGSFQASFPLLPPAHDIMAAAANRRASSFGGPQSHQHAQQHPGLALASFYPARQDFVKPEPGSGAGSGGVSEYNEPPKPEPPGSSTDPGPMGLGLMLLNHHDGSGRNSINSAARSSVAGTSTAAGATPTTAANSTAAAGAAGGGPMPETGNQAITRRQSQGQGQQGHHQHQHHLPQPGDTVLPMVAAPADMSPGFPYALVGGGGPPPPGERGVVAVAAETQRGEGVAEGSNSDPMAGMYDGLPGSDTSMFVDDDDDVAQMLGSGVYGHSGGGGGATVGGGGTAWGHQHQHNSQQQQHGQQPQHQHQHQHGDGGYRY